MGDPVLEYLYCYEDDLHIRFRRNENCSWNGILRNFIQLLGLLAVIGFAAAPAVRPKIPRQNSRHFKTVKNILLTVLVWFRLSKTV